MLLYLKKIKRLLFLSLIAMIGLISVSHSEEQPSSTLANILQQGEIRFITRNNPFCYYYYQDKPWGFEYELAKAFADDLGVKLRIIISDTWDSMIPELLTGKGEIIGATLTITPARRKEVLFSRGYCSVQQHIITHRKDLKIKTTADLVGKTIHVVKGTSYQEQLDNLKKNGLDLTVKTHIDFDTTELIQKVAEAEIDITVADDIIALLERRYYPQIVLAFPINVEENLGWAVNHGDTALVHRINTFFEEIKKNGKFDRIYNHYFGNVDTFDYLDMKKYHKMMSTKLPIYKPLITKAAETHGFDWRLIAAQIYQESHFDPMAISDSGAIGLMQLIFSTASHLGVTNIFDPKQNIEAGVRYLGNLYNFYDNAKDPDRLYLALAAYNAGQGHILDARNLAREMYLDPENWNALNQTLPLLSHPKYYKKAKYGYCRGLEPLKYVNQIKVYYDVLKRRSITSSAGPP